MKIFQQVKHNNAVLSLILVTFHRSCQKLGRRLYLNFVALVLDFFFRINLFPCSSHYVFIAFME